VSIVQTMLQKLTRVIVFVFSTGLLAAQNPAEVVPSVEQARMLLQSPDASDQAWGAWGAGLGKMRDLTPLLKSNLETHLRVNPWQAQNDAVIDTSLDALIQFENSPLPIETLRLLYQRRPAQALILLSRLPSTPVVNAFLVSLTEQAAGTRNGGDWFAATNLLLARQSPGLVPALLRKLELRGNVTIVDPRPAGLGSGTFVSYGLPPGVTQPLVQGFPPWPTYVLEPGSNNGNGSVLASGPIPVIHQRFVVTNGSVQLTTVGVERRPTPAEQLIYLGAAAPNVRIPIRAEASLEIQWNGLASYTADVEKFRQYFLDGHSALIAEMQRLGYLRPEQAVAFARPNLKIGIVDRRSTRTPLQ